MKHSHDLDAASVDEKAKTTVEVTEAEAERQIAGENDYTPEEYAKLRRKIDWVLMPLLMFSSSSCQ